MGVFVVWLYVGGWLLCDVLKWDYCVLINVRMLKFDVSW